MEEIYLNREEMGDPVALEDILQPPPAHIFHSKLRFTFYWSLQVSTLY